MSEDFLKRGRALEDAFFHESNKKLLAEFRDHLQAMERKAQLADASGIHDENVLNRLLEMNIGPETLAALTLIPLVEVAWADGKMPDTQRKAVMEAVEKSGVEHDDDAHALLEEWLNERPGPEMLSVWKDYVVALRQQMDAEAVDQLKHDLLDRAYSIADAAGGILGLGIGSRVSKKEQEMLDELSSAFD